MHLLVGSPVDSGNVFPAYKDWKTHKFFEMLTSLGRVAQMLFRHKRRKLNTLLFFFIVSLRTVASLVD